MKKLTLRKFLKDNGIGPKDIPVMYRKFFKDSLDKELSDLLFKKTIRNELTHALKLYTNKIFVFHNREDFLKFQRNVYYVYWINAESWDYMFGPKNVSWDEDGNCSIEEPYYYEGPFEHEPKSYPAVAAMFDEYGHGAYDFTLVIKEI